ncbi:MAG: NAD(P)/FAD-dependent oxidoreductase [Bacilli bacterium]
MQLPYDERVYDITVIGGGPVGLFTAFYAGIRDASTKIIDSLPQLGGQLAELYPEKFIYDVAGFPKIRAMDLVDQLIEQTSQYHPGVYLGEKVLNLIKRETGIFELHTDHRIHLSRSVIITAGIGAFTPKSLPAENVEKFEGNGIYYYIDDLKRFRNKRVLVVGGGDTAVDFALMLDGTATAVTMIHRREQFRAHEENVKSLFASGVAVKTFYELKAAHGDGSLTGVTIMENRSKQTEELEVDAIIASLGFSASLGPILEWGLEFEGHEIVVDTRMGTNIPGVYAAGDIVTYPGKIKLIATGFGEAPTAVNNAKTYLDPTSKLHPGHSSSRKEQQ